MAAGSPAENYPQEVELAGLSLPGEVEASILALSAVQKSGSPGAASKLQELVAKRVAYSMPVKTVANDENIEPTWKLYKGGSEKPQANGSAEDLEETGQTPVLTHREAAAGKIKSVVRRHFPAKVANQLFAPDAQELGMRRDKRWKAIIKAENKAAREKLYAENQTAADEPLFTPEEYDTVLTALDRQGLAAREDPAKLASNNLADEMQARLVGWLAQTARMDNLEQAPAEPSDAKASEASLEQQSSARREAGAAASCLLVPSMVTFG
jgi:hypothetical protein